jgi:hypothetical protein
VTSYDPIVVDQAVLKALAEGYLSPAEIKKMGAENAAEVGRQLIEIARATRTGGA